MRRKSIVAAAMLLVLGGIADALAAELAPPSPPVPLPPAAYNWTGGYGTGNSNWSDGAVGTSGSFPTSGFLIGGTIAANYQIGQYVFGIEGDGDCTNLKGNSGLTCGAISAVVPPPDGCQTQSQWLATVRGRVGYAFDRILLYGTAGAAIGNIQTGLNPPSTLDNSVEVAGRPAPDSNLRWHKIGPPKSNTSSLIYRTDHARRWPTTKARQDPL